MVQDSSGLYHLDHECRLARGEIVPRDDPNNIYYHVEAFPKFAECDKPIIAAIQGLCAGGGLSMLVETHIRIMADDAYLTDGHLNVGQLISPARYIDDFGWAAAMYLYLCKGKLTAQQALQLGIVNEVCPKEQVVQRVLALEDSIRVISQNFQKTHIVHRSLFLFYIFLQY